MKDAFGDVQRVLVLGGTSDIAQAIVTRLADRRTRHVVLACRRPEVAESYAEGLRSRGVAVDIVPFDADDVAAHDRVLDDAWTRLGEVDIVLVAFAVLGSREAFEADPAAAAAAVHTNTAAPVSLCLGAAARLRRQGHGTIMVLSSVAGERVRQANYVYGGSKAGLDGFAQGLDDALAGTGVRVMIVRPGFVATKMTAGMKPAPFSTTPDAVAAAVTRGLARDARIVWAPPALRYVFAALRHLPRPLWRRLPR